jgi:hypothetical protein
MQHFCIYNEIAELISAEHFSLIFIQASGVDEGIMGVDSLSGVDLYKMSFI